MNDHVIDMQATGLMWSDEMAGCRSTQDLGKLGFARGLLYENAAIG